MKNILKNEQILPYRNLDRVEEYQSNDPADRLLREERLRRHEARVHAELAANGLNDRSRTFAFLEQKASDLAAHGLTPQQIRDRLGVGIDEVRRALGLVRVDGRCR